MAKISYIVSKKSTGNCKGGFHFDGQGSGRWFEKIFKSGKEEFHSEPSEVSNLLSKLIVENDYTFNGEKESRIELEGSAEEIKELGQWSVNYIRAEAATLKPLAEFIREYFQTFCDTLTKTMTTVKWAIDDEPKEVKSKAEKAAKAKANDSASKK